MISRKLVRTDLNLLVALQILLEERNVTRAAERLSVSQPALSKTLQKLRDAFEDELFTRTAHILTSTSFLVQRLTGEVVIDHYTAANFSPLYDVATQTWIDDLADDIVPLDKLPRLLWSNEVAGTITPAAAAETGLAVGSRNIRIHAAAEQLGLETADPTGTARLRVADEPRWEQLSIMPMASSPIGIRLDRSRDWEL